MGNEVGLADFDIKRLARGLACSPAELFEKKVLTYNIDSTGWMNPIINNRTTELKICPFLKSVGGGERLCSVFDYRPLGCRLFPFTFNLLTRQIELPEKNRQRCPDCAVEEGGAPPAELAAEIERFVAYHQKIAKHIIAGMNVFDIKGNGPAKEKFFALLKELYETDGVEA